MEFTSIPEILKFSISKEQASVRFFQDMASKTNAPATKSIFEVLAEREKEHVAELELEIQKLGYTVNTSKEQNTMFHWEESLDSDETIHDMDFIEVLLLAIQKERAAFRLYIQIMATVKNKQLTAVLMDLAEEEMRHVLQLEQEYEAIVHPKH